MNDFVFEKAPWELLLESQKDGSVVSAVTLLSLMEEESEQGVEEAFEILGERHISLDMSALPKYSAGGKAALRLKQEEEFCASGMKPENLEETDPLRIYLEELAGIPAYGDEAVLADSYLSGDLDATIQLTNLGLGRVLKFAGEYAGYNVLLLDLIQEGSIGLWQAIQSFSSGDYASHRDHMIRNAMEKAIFLQARSNGIGQKMRQAIQDYQQVDDKLLVELGRNPSLEEIAEELHMTVEEAQAVQKMRSDALLLQRTVKDTEPEEDPQEDALAVEDTAYFQMRQRISDLLSQLSETDAKLLTMRYGLDNSLPMQAEEIGRKLGMTTGEVTAREAAALAQLRSK